MDWFRRPNRREQLLDCLPAHAVVNVATLSAVVDGDLDGEDRISDLPDDLRRIIVSFLPIKDAVHTTVLARGWRHIWRSTPLSLYDTHLFPSHGGVRADIIGRVLTSHPGPFHVVCLEHCFTRNTELADWSRLLAAGKVRDLVLVSRHPTDFIGRGPSIYLPADILRCANLRRLYLGFWKFRDTSYLPDGPGVFPHLEELGILDICMDRKDDLDHMLASSPKLKKFVLTGYESPGNVHLRGQTPQCVIIMLSAKVNITLVDAPALERLIMWRESLVWAWPVEVNFASATGLKVFGYFKLDGDEFFIRDPTSFESGTLSSRLTRR